MSYIEELQLIIQKELALYHTLNKLEIQNMLYIGYFWLPQQDLKEFDDRLKERHKSKFEIHSIDMEHQFKPPTLLYTNKFTNSFQVNLHSF